MKERVGSGLILLPGNNESPMNYSGNTFPFRQDSTFLYYFGIDAPGLVAVIDCDSGDEILYGDDFTVDDIVWMGPQETIAIRAERVGIEKTAPLADIGNRIEDAFKNKAKVHFLPQYRDDNKLYLSHLLGINGQIINKYSSRDFIMAVASQRSYKTGEEIDQIEEALDISYEMNILAMEMSKPGMYERDVCGAIEGLVLSKGSYPSFPIIFSIHGETLHNHSHDNLMKDGDILVLDSGAESKLHYASDITRTFPVNGKFTHIQRDIYQIVLDAQLAAIEKMKPGLTYKEIHLHSATVIATGLKDLGFMKGNVSDIVEKGAHAMFYPHGLGHMLGLDVHDMENLGEDYIGYSKDIRRSEQFGLAYLRYAKKLAPGLVLTVEPGIYFIPELIRQWKEANKHTEYLDYDKIMKHIDFGGIRIEDNVLITESGHQVLGKPIPKTVEDVEKFCAL